MLTQTTEIAIKSLIYLTLRGGDRLIPPYEIAEKMGCSPSYLAKIMAQLVKAGILRSHRGPQGGMALARDAREIDLMAVVEATQGLLIGNYCRSIGDEIGPVCGFHRAMWDVRSSMAQALKRWTLADLADTPGPTGELAGNKECLMTFVENGAARGSETARPRK